MIRNSLGGENTTTPPIINFYLRLDEETYVYCGLTVLCTDSCPGPRGHESGTDQGSSTQCSKKGEKIVKCWGASKIVLLLSYKYNNLILL